MRYLQIALMLASIVSAFFAGVARGQSDSPPSAADLQLQVQALTQINDLRLTPVQVAMLKGLGSDTAGKLSETPQPVTAEYKAALINLRAALLGKDQKEIENAQTQLDDLVDKLDADSELEVGRSDLAKEKSLALLKVLSVKQIAGYIAQREDDISDPVQLILDAVHHARGIDEDEFQALVDETSQKLDNLNGTVRLRAPQTLIGKVEGLLSRVQHLSAADYQHQLPALEGEAPS